MRFQLALLLAFVAPVVHSSNVPRASVSPKPASSVSTLVVTVTSTYVLTSTINNTVTVLISGDPSKCFTTTKFPTSTKQPTTSSSAKSTTSTRSLSSSKSTSTTTKVSTSTTSARSSSSSKSTSTKASTSSSIKANSPSATKSSTSTASNRPSSTSSGFLTSSKSTSIITKTSSSVFSTLSSSPGSSLPNSQSTSKSSSASIKLSSSSTSSSGRSTSQTSQSTSASRTSTSSSASCAATSPLINSDFETGQASPWAEINGNSSGIAVVPSSSTVQCLSGKYCIALNDGSYGFSQTFDTCPGTTYNVIVYTRIADALRNYGTSYIGVFDSTNGAVYSDTLEYDDAGPTWIKTSISYTAAQTSATLTVYADVPNYDANPGVVQIYADAISVTALGSPAPPAVTIPSCVPSSLLNPGFESGSLSPWTGPTVAPTLISNAADCLSGSYCAGVASSLIQIFATCPGVAYNVSVWSRLAAPQSDTCTSTFYGYDQDDDTTYAPEINYDDAGLGWIQSSISFTPKKKSFTIYQYVSCSSMDGDYGIVVDDFKVTAPGLSAAPDASSSTVTSATKGASTVTIPPPSTSQATTATMSTAPLTTLTTSDSPSTISISSDSPSTTSTSSDSTSTGSSASSGTTSVASCPDAYFSDSGFEDGKFTGWDTVNDAQIVTTLGDGTVCHGGNYCAAAKDTFQLERTLTVCPGLSYSISFYSHVGSSKSTGCYLDVYGSDADSTGVSVYYDDEPSGWILSTFRFNATEDTYTLSAGGHCDVVDGDFVTYLDDFGFQAESS
ncbi:hypothetical protein PVAG01_11396 [Phlyctema vagabunda]|uniref:CBM-cenC domain-containing protein n=1 Tax=Phlyctema vagabunda TaxID=108571 RepID=A0ABR4P2U0_9HELO